MFSMIMEGVELGIFVWLLTLLWLDLTQSVPPTTYCSINISQPFDERFSFISCSLLKQYAHLLLVTIQSWNVLCLEFCLFYQFHLDLLSTSSRPYSDHETLNRVWWQDKSLMPGKEWNTETGHAAFNMSHLQPSCFC